MIYVHQFKNLIDNLLNKVEFFIKEKHIKKIVFGGGVSANSYLKKIIRRIKRKWMGSFYSRNSIYYR